MKKFFQYRLVLVFALVSVLFATPFHQPAQPAEASAVGPLQIVAASCSSVTVRFYYDGLEARDLYIPTLERDRFLLHVQNVTCSGQNCTGQPLNYVLSDTWQTVPVGFGWVTMTATWSGAAQGNGISVTVGQYDINVTPARLVGWEISAYYTCSDLGPCATCGGGYTYPGQFYFQCTTDGLVAITGGLAVVQATKSQIAGPLATAISTRKNQPIAYGNGYSLWALKSNELQVHADANPDGTKLVVPSSICGAITQPAAAGSVPTGSGAMPGRPGSGTGMATTPVTGGGTVHVVQAGENLFRISLRYGVSMQAIADANGIVNFNLIYAGQRLIIP